MFRFPFPALWGKNKNKENQEITVLPLEVRLGAKPEAGSGSDGEMVRFFCFLSFSAKLN